LIFFAATLFCASRAFAEPLEGGTSGNLPVGSPSLHNTHNDERLTFSYRDSLGKYVEEALKALNWQCAAPSPTRWT
jgi:hypothetical protein